MNFIFKILTLLPKKYVGAGIILALILQSTMWIYNKWDAERHWHSWAMSTEGHYYSKVEYDAENKRVRVYWDHYPKIPKCNLEYYYILHRPGKTPLSVAHWHIPKSDTIHYRLDTQDFTYANSNHWGVWLDLSEYEMGPGTYEITIHYEYEDCFNWWVNEWEPDQKIVFKIEDTNDKE